MTKMCKECKVEKSLDEFVNNITGKFNKSSRCRLCMKTHYKKYCKTYYEKNKQELIEKQKKYNENNKDKIKNYMKDYYKNNKN